MALDLAARPDAGITAGAGRLPLRQRIGRAARRTFGPESRWVTVLAAVAAVVYSTVSLLRFRRFGSAGYDLGIFDQVVRQYSAFMAPYSEIKGLDYNIFGDHFHPVIASLAPLYWIWNDPRMLGIAMALLMAASVYPVYLFCRPRLGHWPAFVIAAGYIFWWPVQGLVDFDFHEIAFGVPLLAWIILALDRRRYAAVTVLSVVLLGVREDKGFAVMAIALVLLLRRRWKLALGLFLLGLCTYLVVTGKVIPHYNLSGNFGYWVYSGLGPTMGAAIIFIVFHPLKTLAILFDHDTKQVLWASLFLPVGLLPLGSVYVLPAAPILLSRLLSDRPGTWSTGFQYNAVLAPVLVMAAVDVLFKVMNRFPRLGSARFWAPGLFAATVVAGIAFVPAVFPLNKLVTGEAFTYTTHMAAQQRIVNMIPSGVCVEADDRLVPHLTNRTVVGLIGRQVDYASWAIIDFDQENTGGGGDGNFTPFTGLRYKQDQGFQEVYRQDNIVLLYRPYSLDRGAPEHCSSPYLTSLYGSGR
ncbi:MULTISPECIES: DUF2079 domain-containing protein [Arthrobacter]|uniref:DUF2079 domain-containing protein n=1 Tax=Arthrobacter terricola TaxID=2547396 RepID=A0A4R5KD73_9MICC|nr:MULTISPECIES: DUF2079 domain-containing protein [Arthrobacter]MBT8162685.1 DUF2079 domain-containing protein [Arthrobacter sp. GN70]TDF92458.1 DUF2079 domain-containing protein [Arthrobacter terricola]